LSLINNSDDLYIAHSVTRSSQQAACKQTKIHEIRGTSTNQIIHKNNIDRNAQQRHFTKHTNAHNIRITRVAYLPK